MDTFYDDFDEPTWEALDNEASYVCDSCGEDIVVPLDITQGQNQEYVEDCPVCCNPNVIHVDVTDSGRINIHSRSEQDSF